MSTRTSVDKEELRILRGKARLLDSVREDMLKVKHDKLTQTIGLRTLLDSTDIQLTLNPDTGKFFFW